MTKIYNLDDFRWTHQALVFDIKEETLLDVVCYKHELSSLERANLWGEMVVKHGQDVVIQCTTDEQIEMVKKRNLRIFRGSK